jgi:hypothetical protein
MSHIPSVPTPHEAELVARAVALEANYLEWEIRQAEKAYHRLVKKAAWSPEDCEEVDAIERFLAVHKKMLADLLGTERF